MSIDADPRPEERATAVFDVRTAGESGLLITLDEHQVRPLALWLADGPWAGQIDDIVPGHRTVLIRGSRDLPALASEIRRHGSFDDVIAQRSTKVIEIPVRYDGPDLDAVCEHTGLDREQLIALHTGVEHSVKHFGFSPGFPYLDGSPDAIRIPRRSTPRTQAPAGSVAIAIGMTIIYPGGTPGGWNLIGSTEPPQFWDLERTPPNLLSLGDRIRFRSVA